MNKYITIAGYILELPIVLGILILIGLSIITVVVFFYGVHLQKAVIRRIALSVLVVILMGTASWGLIFSDFFKMERIPKTLDSLQANNLQTKIESNSPDLKLKHRYTTSRNLAKLGFVKNVFDDGTNTYFFLNTVTIPKILVEDALGNLIDQGDNISVKTITDHPFPVIVANGLSAVWYLQFNGFVSHVTQNPEFRPSYDSQSVKVYYSDLYSDTVKLHKDSFICDQQSPDEPSKSIPKTRHYFVFKGLRYYIDDCNSDFSGQAAE